MTCLARIDALLGGGARGGGGGRQGRSGGGNSVHNRLDSLVKTAKRKELLSKFLF